MVQRHGDDFFSEGSAQELKWLKAGLQKHFEIKSEVLGPNEKDGEDTNQEYEEEGEGDGATTSLEGEEAAGEGDDVLPHPSPGFSVTVPPP